MRSCAIIHGEHLRPAMSVVSPRFRDEAGDRDPRRFASFHGYYFLISSFYRFFFQYKETTGVRLKIGELSAGRLIILSTFSVRRSVHGAAGNSEESAFPESVPEGPRMHLCDSGVAGQSDRLSVQLFRHRRIHRMHLRLYRGLTTEFPIDFRILGFA